MGRKGGRKESKNANVGKVIRRWKARERRDVEWRG